MGFLEQEWQRQCEQAKEFTRLACGDFGKLSEDATIFPPLKCSHPEDMYLDWVKILSG